MVLSHANMVEQQIRPWNVFNPRVLDCLYQVPREIFVPAAYQNLAYADIEIPLGQQRWMFAPKIVAKALDVLAITSNDRALVIGTSSGYISVLLAKLAQSVVSVDARAEFNYALAEKLFDLNINNLQLETADMHQGWQQGAPYDVIILTGSVLNVPQACQEQLALGGRLFAIVGSAPVMQARRISHHSDNTWQTEILFETCAAALPLSDASPIFHFNHHP
jgi:protein-L-isoaspartate(D-aspartate) O-methyltransferase